MLKVINGVFVFALIMSAFVLYSLEHSLRKNERYVAQLERDTRNEAEHIKLLNAEWSYLIRPERLERLAAEHLQLQQVRPYQLVQRDEFAGTVRLRPVIEPAAGSGDLIGGMLKDLQ